MKKVCLILAVLLFVSLWFNAWQLSLRLNEHCETRVHVDTVRYSVCVPKDSVVLRFKTVRLAKARLSEELRVKSEELSWRTTDSTMVLRDTVTVRDSVEVVVPITQKRFESDAWKIWVSGYMVNLDSAESYKTTVTIEKPVKRRRWAVGPQVGIGIGKNGVQPYVGIGGTYDILP